MFFNKMIKIFGIMRINIHIDIVKPIKIKFAIAIRRTITKLLTTLLKECKN